MTEHGVPYATIVALLFLSRFPRFPVAIFWSLGMTIFRVFFALLGFRRIGVRPNSYAASYQSRKYGGYTPNKEDSYFSSVLSAIMGDNSSEQEPSLFSRLFYKSLSFLYLFSGIVLALDIS